MLTPQITIYAEPHILWMLPYTRQELCEHLKLMLSLTHPEGVLELSILDDNAMEELNNTAMLCRGPTNILSFPDSDISKMQKNSLGWMAFCAPALHRECLLYGQDRQEHTLRLLAHGLAHLLGYDHSSEMDDLTERLTQKSLTL